MFAYGGTKQQPPTLHFPRGEWDRLRAYVQACPAEINGFGLIDQVDNVFVVRRIYILEQEVTAASATIDALVMAQHRYQLVQEGREQHMRLQWHSHVEMEAYFSPTDLTQIETYTDWMISLVTNKRGEFSVRLDLFAPRLWVPMEISVSDTLSDELMAEVSEEIGQKVRLPWWFGRGHPPQTESAQLTLMDAAVLGEEVHP